ncbi:hypothetical protein [Lysinibacillus fusiformis]|uniref:hypothetical protein n=1 Tax=Lysinibacillus fusiformis TaxID=28031 RepID=UPI001587919A|nr:hypothetical protein [Lysinibacillus fusiformis]
MKVTKGIRKYPAVLYSFTNEKIKGEVRLNQEILIILDFLIEKGSVAGYMLRENIL